MSAPDRPKTPVTFYHSAICPRCRLASIALGSIIGEYPHISIERVEYLTNVRAARAAGVRSIPSLSAEGRTLSAFVLTKSAMRGFLDSIGGA